MSLPPGFIDELRTRVSLSSVVGRKVTWDLRKSNMGKGDMWAPCPFHQEKSASFHVDDRKGFYYCFGCHAKGDAVSFVKETENVGFLEAVEILAREAGMPIPARDPQAAQKADHRTQLVQVMEEAVKWFRMQLRTSAAADAREYLVRRKLSPEAQERWNIGFAPASWTALTDAMKQKEISTEMLIAAGIAAKSDTRGAYDRFRNRIIFPIRDARGRAISLGGRAMDPNDQAKYLNGPETELFDKGRSLYNMAPAREAAGKGKPLIVAEGYMDVIALSEAGFTATVAPLGTAVTEDQLRLMWRIHPEPIIALDGDKAGIAAALRVIDLALPVLEAGQGLRFAILPTGLDPDDLIKAQGALAMQRVLDAAQPMVNLLWSRETDGRNFDSPERKATLDKTLRATLARIKDATIRSHYEAEIKRLTWPLFNARSTKPNGSKGQKGFQPPTAPLAITRASPLANASDLSDDIMQEAAILAVVINHPMLLDEFVGDLERVEMIEPGHLVLLSCLLRYRGLHDYDELWHYISTEAGDALETLFSRPHVLLARGVDRSSKLETAHSCLNGVLRTKLARHGSKRETQDAMEDIPFLADERITYRLVQANEARFSAEGGPKQAKPESIRAENGVDLSKDEVENARKSFSNIDYSRGGRPKK